MQDFQNLNSELKQTLAESVNIDDVAYKSSNLQLKTPVRSRCLLKDSTDHKRHSVASYFDRVC